MKKESSAKEKKVKGYPCTGEGLFYSESYEHFRINLSDKNFDYEKKLAEIKAMTGKWWSKSKKCWYIPPSQFQQIIDYVKTYRIPATPESVAKAKKLYMEAYRAKQNQTL